MGRLRTWRSKLERRDAEFRRHGALTRKKLCAAQAIFFCTSFSPKAA
jgi:hypothetical protein